MKLDSTYSNRQQKDYFDEKSKNVKMLKLSELASKEKNSIKRGPFGSAITKDIFVPSGYKIYEQKHAISGDFSLGNYYIDERKFQQLSDFELKESDIIISCSGTIGRVAIAPRGLQRGIINQALLKITLNKEIILPEYFRYLFESRALQTKLRELTLGSGIKNVASVKSLKEMKFPVPSLVEQERIVTKLNGQIAQIGVMKVETRKQLAAAEDFFRSLLAGIYDNILERRKISELVTQTEMRDPRKEPKRSFLYVDISGVDNKMKKITNIVKLSGLDAPSRARNVVRENDVILSTTRPNLNAVAVVPKEMDNQIVSTGFCVLRCSKELNNKYLFFFLQSKDFIDRVSSIVKGALYPAITDEQVLHQDIPYLNYCKQEELVEIIENAFLVAQEINHHINRKLQAISQLPSSIIDEVFRKYQISEVAAYGEQKK
jgi:type I restriction enzyme S subunit